MIRRLSELACERMPKRTPSRSVQGYGAVGFRFTGRRVIDRSMRKFRRLSDAANPVPEVSVRRSPDRSDDHNILIFVHSTAEFQSRQERKIILSAVRVDDGGRSYAYLSGIVLGRRQSHSNLLQGDFCSIYSDSVRVLLSCDGIAVSLLKHLSLRQY